MIPREQLINPVDLVVGEAAEGVGEPCLRVDVIQSGGLNQCVDGGCGLPDPQYATVTSSMFGLSTILLAWLLLKEHMSLPQWGGCILAFCGAGYLAL